MTAPLALTDDLVADAVNGDADALGVIYAVLSPKVLGYLKAHGAEDPEGLTNDVFVHVLRRLGGLVGGASGLRTFVFSVAHARLVDDVRRRARRPVEQAYEPDLDDRREHSAEHAALSAADGGTLNQMLGRLGDDQRSVITLRILGDLTIEQTAEILGKTTGAVKQLQRRGLLTLRSMMERGEVAL
ncbi:MAG: RNA polymerase sigma factor [Nocardioidaceae bacterium]